MPKNKDPSTPPPMIGKIGPYTGSMTPPFTPKPAKDPVFNDSPHKKVVAPPPPVQPPPHQFEKSVATDGFLKNAVTKVQTGSHPNHLLDSTKSVVSNTKRILEVPAPERDWKYVLEEGRLRQNPLCRQVLETEAEIMSGRFKIPTMEEMLAKRKSRKAKGKETKSSEPQTQSKAASMEMELKALEIQPEKHASKKRKHIVDSEEDLENVIVKIPRGTTIISDPSGLQPFVDGLLLKEDESRLADLGPVEAARRAEALSYQVLECSIFQRKFVEARQRRIKDLEKSNTALRKELAESKLEIGIAQKMAQEAKANQKMAELTLRLERETTKLAIDSYKEALDKLEKEKIDLVEQMDNVAFEAMVKERASLMQQFLAGEHVNWTPEKWVKQYERIEAGLSLSSSEDEEETP